MIVPLIIKGILGKIYNAVDSRVLLQFISSLEIILKELGIVNNIGSGVEAVHEVLHQL